MEPRELIEAIYRSAIERVDAYTSVASAVVSLPPDRLQIGRATVQIPAEGVYAIAFGKAALPMMAAVHACLGARLVRSIAVTKAIDERWPVAGEVLIGSHPVPDGRSLHAGKAVFEFAEDIPRGALVLCLISGGGSALMELMREGSSIAEMQFVTHRLLEAGAEIDELNAVRGRFSRIKAGGLLGALQECTVWNVVISDVLGDNPSVIASGPTVPASAPHVAEEVLQRFGVSAALPPEITDTHRDDPGWLIVANLDICLDAAADAARLHGFEACVLSRSLRGESRHVAGTLASIARDTALGRTSIQPPVCLLAGGETVVTVQGGGAGGRNTEGALAAAIAISDVPGVTLGFLATDGDDGTTGLAGAIVDGSTVGKSSLGSALDALSRNDSATFLATRGATVRTGPSGTNVNDIVIGIVS